MHYYFAVTDTGYDKRNWHT